MRSLRSVAALVRRSFGRLVATLFAVSVLTFLLTSLLPGDPAVAILGAEGITPEAVERVRSDLGLDDPLPVRYAEWLTGTLRGDLGESSTLGRPVSTLIADRLPVTLEIVFLALAFSVAVAVPIGVYNAYRPSGLAARFSSLVTYALLSIPSFVVGIVLILILAIQYDLLPASGWVDLADDPVENLRRVAMPAAALALPQLAVFSRVLRGDMMATLDNDFVAFADSKGLSTPRILFGHAFRPSSFSLLTLIGTSIGYLMGGTVIIETMFNLPGIGTLLVSAIYQRDLMTVQGVTLFVATSFVVVNFTVDVLYSVLDPRIRRGHGAAV